MDTNIDKKLGKHLELITKHARVALRKIMKPAKYSLDDLIQEGVVAFLYAEKNFVKEGASFKTYLTRCLRNHFTNLVKQTYRNKEISSLSFWNSFPDAPVSGEINSIGKKNTISDASEIVQVFFIIKSFSADELEYTNAMLSLVHRPRGSRRKTARKDLGISYEREMELRRSISDKIRK